MRLGIDTGGTFTDLVVSDNDGQVQLFKAPTTPDEPAEGVMAVLNVAAQAHQMSLRAWLSQAELCLHGTTRALNAVITDGTARTAFLTTQGHPDILVIGEGGRHDPFDVDAAYPEPYVPRSRTFEVRERIDYEGEVIVPLDADQLSEILAELQRKAIEAIAVCFLWSIANPRHEQLAGELIRKHLPDVPFTLSHQLNPTIREYRRGVAAAIDASLKPLMQRYIADIDRRLREHDFTGRLLMLTSSGTVLDARDVAEAPIHVIRSGPAMAPVAGRRVASQVKNADTVIVTDAGGTTYDVSVVRGGELTRTRETWLGRPYLSHKTGFASVDVRSVGAGGGSIAWVDSGGLLRVGPMSAGASPGPVAYRLGGQEPTVTDAALALGYIDPDAFLGGEMKLDPKAAEAAIDEKIARPLGMGIQQAAAAVLELMTEQMARAITEVCLMQGVDSEQSLLVGGGGAAGLNAIAVARRLRAPAVLIPDSAAALSAAGALVSELSRDFAMVHFTGTADFDRVGVNRVLSSLSASAQEFLAGPGAGARAPRIDYSVEGHYPQQAWDIEVPLRSDRLEAEHAIWQLSADFHDYHQRVYAVADRESEVELLTWRARARCQLVAPDHSLKATVGSTNPVGEGRRVAYFPTTAEREVRVLTSDLLRTGEVVEGPAIIEAPYTTIVVEPESSVEGLPEGGILARPRAENGMPTAKLGTSG